MDSNSFFEFVKQELRFESFSKTERNDIENFLLGNTENIVVPVKHMYVSYNVYEIIYNELTTENKEMAKKAVYLFNEIYENSQLSSFWRKTDRYKVYYNAGFSEKFVIMDIIQSFDIYAKQYEDMFKEQITEFSKSTASSMDLCYLFEYYGDILKKIIFKENVTDQKESMAQLLGSAYSLIWYKDDPNEKQQYLNIIEKNIYGIMKKNYGSVDFNKIFENMDSFEFYELADKCNIFYSDAIMNKIYANFCMVFRNYSKLIHDAMRAYIVFMTFENYPEKLLLKYNEMLEFYREFNLPYICDIKLCLKKVYNTFRDIYNYVEELQNLYNDHTDEFVKLYNYMLENNKIEACLLLSVMIKNNNIPQENFVEQAEVIIIKNIKSEDKKEFFDYDIESFKKKNLDFTNFKLDLNSGNISFVLGIITSSCAIFDYSVLARNIVCTFLYQKMFNGSIIEKFATLYNLLSKENDKNKYQRLLEYLPVDSIIDIYLNLYNGRESENKEFYSFLELNKENAVSKMTSLISKNDSSIIKYMDIVYSNGKLIDYKYIIPAFEHKLKGVVTYVWNFFEDKENEVRDLIEPFKNSKQQVTREAVNRLLKTWDFDKIIKKLDEIKSTEELTEYISKMYNSENDKIIPYLKDVDFGDIRFKDSEKKADSVIIKYYIAEFMLLQGIYILFDDTSVIKECEKIERFLNKNDLKLKLKEVYKLWVQDGADTKKKNILIPYLINCNDNDITELKAQIDKWTEVSRGALAAFAVKAMSLNGNNIALMIIDGISTKYKNKQVKNAAAEAMESAANVLGITKDELADKIVPNLGFDISRKRIFDFGSRKFKAVLNDKLQITLFDEKEKQIKSLPKSNLNDIAELAQKANEDFKGMKKQLKTVLSTQKNRLEQALITGRRWSRESWETLFIKNPIMNGFAIGLIWEEVDESGNILGTFRYMEDGSFNTANEEEYIFSDKSFIILFNVVDVDKETIEMWKQQLEDYEIIQPFNQIEMPIYKISEDEKMLKKIKRFLGTKVYFGTIKSITDKYGWRKQAVEDAGYYEGYYYEDISSKVGIRINFDELFIGIESSDVVKMGSILFYNVDSIKYGCYYNINDKDIILPKDVPNKIANFALMTADLIAQKEIK